MNTVILIVLLIVYFVIANFTGKIAKQKGLSYAGFFIFSMFAPLIALLVAAFLKENKSAVESQLIGDTGDSKKCPFCAEVIKKEAKICRFCRKELPEITEVKIKEINRQLVLNYDDYKTAGNLLDYANKDGYSKAKYLLGKLYLDGDLVEKDLERAKLWLQMSADEGYEEAIELLNNDIK